MSRAFVKENDLEHAGIDIPERPISAEPNYVTPNGLQLLKEQLKSLENDLQHIKQKDDQQSQQIKFKTERDIRYILARLESAILIKSENQSTEKILFGATVNLEDDEGKNYKFKIVGEDEADIKNNKLSYVAPLSKQLIGREVGDEIVWVKATETIHLTITSFEY
jgi:transcription elongation factor GreB